MSLTLQSLRIVFLSIMIVYTLSLSIRQLPLVRSKQNVNSVSRLFNFDGYSQPEKKRGAYAAAVASRVPMPCIILVNPFLDQNVGSVARSMLNFGLTELRIVNPKCDIKSPNALALAAGASEILDNAKVYDTLAECIADLQRVFATTIRPRHMTQIILTPAAAAIEAIPMVDPNSDASEQTYNKVGILFGTERSGLSNDDVAMADAIVTIPVFMQFSSLNLAQAVNIIGFELWKRYLETDKMSAMPPGLLLSYYII